MAKNKGPFYLVLNGAASEEIEWHCKHYVGRNLMVRYNNGKEFAKANNLCPKNLAKTFDTYTQHAKAKKDPFGKRFF